MYKFIDVTEVPEEINLPSEALKINGDYIEYIVPGYKTLYVSGREALAPELNTYETGIRNGANLKSRRYPARTIVVGYQLAVKSNTEFREAYNKLAELLNVENAELIFNDEPDKFFIGTPSAFSEIEPGRNAVLGEFEILCVDPFKYSVEEHEIEPSLDDGTTFIVDYKGSFPSYPTVEADFYVDESGTDTDNGRCGYVAFLDDDENILQFGNPEELAEEAIEVVNIDTNTCLVPTTKVLLNHSYKKSNGWSNVKSKYTANNGVIYGSSVKTGSVGAKHSMASTAEGTYYLTAASFGSGKSYHGPTVTHTLSATATDFEFSYSQKLCVGSAKADKKQRGRFQMILSDSKGGIVAGVDIYKGADGTKGTYRMIVNGTVQKQASLDLSYHNKYFGANRAENKKKNLKAITTVKSSRIIKNGNKITFNLGGINHSFTVDAVKAKAVSKITVMFAGKGKSPALEYNGLYWMKMIKNYQETVTDTIETITTEWHDVQNKFNPNDILIVECASGSVKLNDLNRPDLGALGNDWEGFCLLPGVNQIMATYSDWVESAYKPNFKLSYREVYL